MVSRVSIVGFEAYWKAGLLFLVLGSSCSENKDRAQAFMDQKASGDVLILIACCLLLNKSERDHQSWTALFVLICAR